MQTSREREWNVVGLPHDAAQAVTRGGEESLFRRLDAAKGGLMLFGTTSRWPAPDARPADSIATKFRAKTSLIAVCATGVVMAMLTGPVAAAIPTQLDVLYASNASEHLYFGTKVALSGNTAVIGVPDASEHQGAAYVFTWNGTAWVERAILTASDGAAGDYFGSSVAVDGGTIVIGAPGHGAGEHQGAAFVFTGSGASWAEQEELASPDPYDYGNFGSGAIVTGDTAMIGEAGGCGKVHVFTRTGVDWNYGYILLESPDACGIGWAMAIDGNTAIFGGQSGDGEAHVFTWDGSAWTKQAKLVANDAADDESYDMFGRSVAIQGDTAVIGASGSDATAESGGAAYVFVRTGGSWAQQAKLTSSGCQSYDQCGGAVGVSGDTAFVGSQFSGISTEGAVYVFTRDGTDWSPEGKLNPTGMKDASWFGFSMAVRGETALIGAPGNVGDYFYGGAVYVFGLTGATDETPPVVTSVNAADVVYPADATATATATDAGSNINSAKYSIDGGAWTAMSATDGAFDEKSEGLTVTIEGLTAGEHTVCVRATDTEGNTSLGLDCDDFEVTAADLTITFAGVYIDMDSLPTTTLKATVSGPDACKIGATVEFYERIGTSWSKLGEDVTDEVGRADLSLALALGVHEIKVVVPDQYLDDGETPECTGDYDTGMTVVADANAASSGGGWYKADDVAPPRVNFGYVANVKFDKKTAQWVTSGNFLWLNQDNFRLKGRIEQSASIACPSGAGYVKCAAFAGSGTLYEHNDAYDPTVDDPSQEWTGNSPLEVSFVATVYDGGSSTVCQKKRCTVTERPDAIMMQINGASIPAAPYEAITLQGGGITVKK